MKYAAFLLLFSLSCGAMGQTKQHRIHSRRNIAWFTPSATPRINGLAVGLAAVAIGQEHQLINGVNVEATFAYLYPVFPFINIYETIFLPVNKWHNGHLKSEQSNRFFYWSDSIAEVINGVNISLGSWLAEQKVNGVTLSLSGNSYVQHNGLCVSGIANWVARFNGVAIGAFGNVSRTGSGVQIGLVNSCGNCSGLQIGLLNQNGNRITPFVGIRSRMKALKLAAKQPAIPAQTRHLDARHLFFTRSVN